MRRVILVGLLATALTSASPALADPPATHNKNTVVDTFHCSRGAEARTFQTIAILQSAQIALQLVDGNEVVIFTHVEVDGQVVYDIPGQADRSDLWTCTIEAFTGVVAQVFLTPRG